MSEIKLNKFELKMEQLTERKGFKIALFSIAATTILGNAVITSSLPSMQEYFSSKILDKSSFAYTHLDILIRLVLTTPAIFVMLLAPFAGYLMDRFGKLKFLYPAMALWAFAGMAGFFLDGLFSIIFSRALLGVAMAFLMTGASALLADYYTCGKPGRRAAALGMQGFFTAAGGSLFILGGGILGEYSWREPFLIYSLGLLILIAASFYLFEPRHKAQIFAEEKKIDLKKFLVIYFAGFFCMLAFYIIPTQIPYFMQDKLGYSPKFIGTSIALMAFLEGVFSIFYKRLVKVLAIKGVYIFSFSLMGLGFFLLHFFHSLIMINFSLILVGMALAYILVNNAEYLFKICPIQARARVFGLLASFTYLSQFLSPILTQPIVVRIDYTGLFLFVSLLIFLIVLLFALFFKEKQA